MVTVETTLKQLNAYMRKPLTMSMLRDAMEKMGFDLDSDDPEALKLDVTADRPDMISSAGVARVLNAYLGFAPYSKPSSKDSDYVVRVDKSVVPVRPFTAALVVKNIRLTQEKLDELIWIQEKLHDTFARQRKKAAIGIYPNAKIAWPITFTGEAPEKIVFPPLGSDIEFSGRTILETHPVGRKFAHLLKELPIYPVFRDAKKKVLSMPPIINSNTVGNVTPHDTELFVEVSGHYWPTVSVLADILAHVFSDMKGDIYSVRVLFPNDQTKTTPECTMESIAVDVSLVTNA